MLHEIIPPKVAALPGARLGNRVNPHVYTFGEICEQLGLFGRSLQYRQEYIRTMVRTAGFPSPLPAFNRSARTMTEGAEAVTPKANWQRAAVDAWFDRRLPPGARSADVAQGAIAEDLDDRADNINALITARGA